jgi:hypothetical protein
MITFIRKWLRDPVFLLALSAGLIAFAVQSGELATSDTTHRLQATHALWTSEPPVLPYEYPDFRRSYAPEARASGRFRDQSY